MPDISDAIPAEARSAVYDLLLLCFGVGLAGSIHAVSTMRRERSCRAGGPTSVAETLSRVLGAAAAGLVGIHLFDLILKEFVGFPYTEVMPLFDLTKEQNLPTLFATSLLLIVAGEFLIVACAVGRGSGQRRWWAGLGAISGFLALDEFAALHERLIPILQELSGRTLLFGREWVLVYGAVLALLAVVYVPFMRRLDRTFRRRLAVAVVVFTAGAAGLEVLAAGIRWYFPGTRVRFVAAAEEALELAGLVVLVFALTDYLERRLGWLAGTFDARARE